MVPRSNWHFEGIISRSPKFSQAQSTVNAQLLPQLKISTWQISRPIYLFIYIFIPLGISLQSGDNYHSIIIHSIY